MQLRRLNTFAFLALFGASLTLAGCDSLYDRTKGWANDLDAAIGEEWDRMAAARRRAAAEKEAAKAAGGPTVPPLMAPEAMRDDLASPGAGAAPLASMSIDGTAPDTARAKLMAPESTLQMPPKPLWATLPPQPEQGPEQIEGPDRIATATSPSPPEQPTLPSGSRAALSQEEAPTVRGVDTSPPSARPEPVDQSLAIKPQEAKANDAASQFAIHLSSLSSEQGAESHWTALRKAFPGTLRDLVLDVQRADLGERGVFFRILAGPFANQNEAKRACEELNAQRQYCRIADTGPPA